MYAIWAEESLTWESVQAPSQRGLTKPNSFPESPFRWTVFLI